MTIKTELHCGDAKTVLSSLPSNAFSCCVTSPPYYGLRNYGTVGEIGSERTYLDYIDNLVGVFREMRRCMSGDSTFWLNMGDSYCNYRTGHKGGMPAQSFHDGKINDKPDKVVGCNRRQVRQPKMKEKDLMGIPWRVALALHDDGWYLRSDCTWSKSNPTPEKVADRPSKSHEYVFLLTKNKDYYFDKKAVEEDGVDAPRGRRTVWQLPVEKVAGHHAAFPESLASVCVRSGSRPGSTVVDPFSGSGTTLAVANKHGRNGVGIDISHAYVESAKTRIASGGWAELKVLI